MSRIKKAYVEGFKDCIECFEGTIQMQIENITEDNSKSVLLKSFDSVIATLYLTKLHASDLTRMDDELNELFTFKEVTEEDFNNIQNLFDNLKEDNYE